MFKCPKCDNMDSQVIEGRFHNKTNNYIRLRKCRKCGHRIFTAEREINYERGLKKMSDCYRDKNREKSKREREIRRNYEECE